MGQAIKDLFDWMSEPTRFFVGMTALLLAVFYFRKFFARNIVIVTFFVVGTLFFAWAWGDPNFNLIVTKPDNVPIVILLAAVVFFTWLALRRGVQNDERMARGEPPLEGELAKQKVFTWPDLVFSELICVVLFGALITIWSVGIPAPIEEAAAQARTPNPSKAPWYFLGLQEMLVYFDPWIAGVLLPSFIIVGLCAIPYLDVNPRGNGYFTVAQRPFAVLFFWFGFILFWVALVILGTFLRGPNWSFFGPFEYWDPHKLEPMVNVDLSTYFWVMLLDMPRPDSILMREAPGIIALLGFFTVVPLLAAKTVFKRYFEEAGPVRFHIFMHLMCWFLLMPMKMLLRWTVSLKYIVGIPEYFFNV